MPWLARWPSTRSIMGAPPTGSICFGVVSVSGRSRVPKPPTSTTAFIGAAARTGLGASLRRGGRGGAGGWDRGLGGDGRLGGNALLTGGDGRLHVGGLRPGGGWLGDVRALGGERDRDQVAVLRGERREVRVEQPS